MKQKLLTAATLLAMAMGCKDQPEQIPAYLHILPFTVNAQGDASWHKITDGWLYVNGEYLGAYTLPATVPVLASGASDIIIFPGVKQNGILASPNIYPALKRYDAKGVVLTPAENTDIQPSTVYDPEVKFPFGVGRGDFDFGSSIILENRDDDAATTFSITTDGAFSGKCILMQVDTAHPVIEIATEAVSDIPVTGSPEVWMEMHYQCDMPFSIYMLYPDNGTEGVLKFITINKSENWNKIYLNLTDVVTASQAVSYKVFFKVELPTDDNGNYTQTSGSVRLDNLRLTHL